MRKKLTVEQAKKLLTKRIKEFLDNGGELKHENWGELGVNYDGDIVLKDGPTCALGAAMVGATFTGEWDWCEPSEMASRVLNLKEDAVDKIVAGFDTPWEAGKSKWRQLGAHLRNKFLPIPASAEEDYY